MLSLFMTIQDYLLGYTCWKGNLRFQRLVENQFERHIKIFQRDGGGEFSSNLLLDHIKSYDIELNISCPGTRKSDRVVEWKHRHIVDTGLTTTFLANLPLSLWVDVSFLHLFILLNGLPSSVIKMRALIKTCIREIQIIFPLCLCWVSPMHKGYWYWFLEA